MKKILKIFILLMLIPIWSIEPEDALTCSKRTFIEVFAGDRSGYFEDLEFEFEMEQTAESRQVSVDDSGLELVDNRFLVSVVSVDKKALPVKKFACAECPYSADTKTILNRHMRIHTGEKPYSCDICGQAFSQNVHLKKHKNSECGKNFKRNYDLKTHMLSHAGIKKPVRIEKKFICNVEDCMQAFNNAGHLNRHKLKHTQEKKFFCALCNKAFARNDCLNKHLTTHKKK